jgi:hypothetical protein
MRFFSFGLKKKKVQEPPPSSASLVPPAKGLPALSVVSNTKPPTPPSSLPTAALTLKDKAARPWPLRPQPPNQLTTAPISASHPTHSLNRPISISKPSHLRATSTSSALNFGTASLPDRLDKKASHAALNAMRTTGGRTRGAFDPPPFANLPAVRQRAKSLNGAVSNFSHFCYPTGSSNGLNGYLRTPVPRPFSIPGGQFLPTSSSLSMANGKYDTHTLSETRLPFFSSTYFCVQNLMVVVLEADPLTVGFCGPWTPS